MFKSASKIYDFKAVEKSTQDVNLYIYTHNAEELQHYIQNTELRKEINKSFFPTPTLN